MYRPRVMDTMHNHFPQYLFRETTLMLAILIKSDYPAWFDEVGENNT
jgi:hypothetical protein